MAFWDFLTKENEETEEQRAYKNYSLNCTFNGFISGVSSNRYSVDQILSIPICKACLDTICNNVKDLPIELYKQVDDKTVEKINDDYRIELLNKHPNPFSTGVDFKGKLVKELVLHGNAYTQIERKGNKVTALWNMSSENVSITKFVDPKNPYIIKDIKINLIGVNDPVKMEDMIIMVNDSEDSLTGKGVIARGDKIIELALNELNLSTKMMQNGSVLSGIVKSDKPLTESARKNLRDGWQKLYTGSENSGKVVILEQGLDFEKLSYSASELDLSASRKSTNSDICQLFGVPEQLVSADANTYGSVESMSIRFLQYCISPILSIIESALNRSLLLEKEKSNYFFKFDTTNILQSTQKERYETLSAGLSAGILTLNEARAKENLQPIPYNDDFLKISLGSVLYYPEKSQLFVPNMSTVFSSKDNSIISSPELEKEKLTNGEQISPKNNENPTENTMKEE